MLIHALALLLAQVSPAPRIPSIEFASRPLSTWCVEFEESGHLSHDALWCVYWHGPDDTITTKLVEWLAATPSESIRAELEVILHHRGIPHPCTQRGLDDLAFDIARPDLGTPTLELEAALDSRDPGRILDSASALVRRDEDAEFAVRCVLLRTAMDPMLVRVLVDFAGTPADHAICALLDDLHVEFAVKEHVLTTIGFSAGADVVVVAPTLARFAARTDAIGATARRRFVDVLFGEDPWRDWNAADGDTLHFVAHWPTRNRVEDSNASRMFGDALAHWLAALPATSCPDASEFWLVLEAARRSDAVARSITPTLLSWLEGSPERATFARGILAHAGCVDAALQDAVAQSWNACADDPAHAGGVMPCMREYAPATWSAFERAFAVASDDDRARRMLALADANKLDGDREPLARWPRLRVESRWNGSPRLDLSGLERILRVTALTPADHHDLPRALRHCIAVDRLETLRFVKRHGLASEELRAAIEAARTDCDERVRALAKE